ncbi:MAG: hypothetical protein HY532_00070 [Chloroflexi bacterium]|nr:hypothetical protein [Chloroflexota bacterium]
MGLTQGQVLFAAGLILLGILFLIANLGLFDITAGGVVSTLWPLVIIALGLWKLATDRGVGLAAPAILIGLGVVFLLASLDILPWGSSWPLVIIVIGLAILLQGVQLRKNGGAPEGDDSVSIIAMFSGAERRVTSQAFRGGKISAIFGGGELDLRDARLAPGAVLSITALCGGVENKQKGTGGPATPLLTVNASVTFGGLEIKN